MARKRLRRILARRIVVQAAMYPRQSRAEKNVNEGCQAYRKESGCKRSCSMSNEVNGVTDAIWGHSSSNSNDSNSNDSNSVHSDSCNTAAAMATQHSIET